jgi:hypothetical protein
MPEISLLLFLVIIVIYHRSGCHAFDGGVKTGLACKQALSKSPGSIAGKWLPCSLAAFALRLQCAFHQAQAHGRCGKV